MGNQKPISHTTITYWSQVKLFLNTAGKYAHIVKLMAAFKDEATRFKVEETVKKYYDGDIKKMESSLQSRYKNLHSAIQEVNKICRQLKIPEIKKEDVIIELLLEKSRRDFYRNLIKKLLKSNKIAPIQFLELEYRKSQKGS